MRRLIAACYRNAAESAIHLVNIDILSGLTLSAPAGDKRSRSKSRSAAPGGIGIDGHRVGGIRSKADGIPGIDGFKRLWQRFRPP